MQKHVTSGLVLLRLTGLNALLASSSLSLSLSTSQLQRHSMQHDGGRLLDLNAELG